MILMFDVGNTELKIAVADDSKIISKYRFTTNPSLSDDELYLRFYGLVKDYNFENIIIASVHPEMTFKLRSIAKKHFFINPIVLEAGVKTGIKLKTDNPLEVGADIVAGAVASTLVSNSVLFIDLGTAIKYVYVENKTLLGVVISPGIEISLKALKDNTALLPNVEIKTPNKVLGTNTVSCMQSGIIYGTASQIDGLIERIKAEIGHSFDVVLTGGLADIILPHLKTKVIYRPLFVFEGLLEIYHKNK